MTFATIINYCTIFTLLYHFSFIPIPFSIVFLHNIPPAQQLAIAY